MKHDDLVAYIDHLENTKLLGERLIKPLKNVVELHSPHKMSDVYYESGDEVAGMCEYYICAECSDWIDVTGEVDYPCATIQALSKGFR